jgi:hypothetical protein
MLKKILGGILIAGLLVGGCSAQRQKLFHIPLLPLPLLHIRRGMLQGIQMVTMQAMKEVTRLDLKVYFMHLEIPGHEYLAMEKNIVPAMERATTMVI